MHAIIRPSSAGKYCLCQRKQEITALLATYQEAYYPQEEYDKLQRIQSLRAEVQLQWVTQLLCPRFHCDANTYRMLCTYTGEGTLWTPWDNVRWENTRLPQNLIHPNNVFQSQPGHRSTRAVSPQSGGLP